MGTQMTNGVNGGCPSVPGLLPADVFLYLHSVAEVGPSGHSHHGQQACPRSNVQDDDLLPTGLHSGHRCSDALVVFYILTTTTTETFSLYLYIILVQILFVTLGFPNTHPVPVMKHICVGRPGKKTLINLISKLNLVLTLLANKHLLR